MSNIMVSVWVLAYNHQKYIREALESFVTQETDFAFEVLINDDVSTDDTKKIISEYAEKYPDIIKPVFQKENQYSKGVRIFTEILLPLSKGKYFAMCEGDDFWTDPHKLQKQVDYLEAHPECSLCIHNSKYVKEDGSFLEDHIITEESAVIPTDQIILGGGGFCSTNSIMAPIALAKNMPKCFDLLHLDYAWQTCLASMGTVYCFKDVMSAYRTFSEGSWSSQVEKGPADKIIANAKKNIEYLIAFDAETDEKYHEAVMQHESFHLLAILFQSKSTDILKDPQYKAAYQYLSKKTKFQVYCKIHLPFLYGLLGKLLHKNKQ